MSAAFYRSRRNVFDSLSKFSQSSIFKDEKYLHPDYVPTEILHRETEIKDIASSINRIVQGSNCENLMIIGPPGTGKTVSLRYLLDQLREYTQRVRGVYVNCWEYSTRFSILCRIAEDLGMFVPRRGVSVDEIMRTIGEGYLKNGLNGLIVVLDEFDRLFASFREESQVLYNLTRTTEIQGMNITVVTISNRRDILAYLDERIRSSFYPRVIEFKPYDSIALKDILKERARYAFYPNVLDEHVIPLCAGIGVKRGGDARVAIRTLWLAGRNAERKGKSKVTVEDVQEIKSEVDNIIFKEYHLGKIERKILNVLKKEGTVTSGQLYSKLSKLNITDRMLRYYIKRLREMGLISSEIRQVEGRGRTQYLSLKR